MATAIWRNASRFRNFRRCLYTHTLSQCRSSFPASSPMTDSLHPPSPPFLRPVIAVGADFKSLGICGRYLSNSTTAATDNQEKASFSSSKANSEGTQNAGGSQQNSGDAGKPVRGGPVSWLSFLLLLATGIGIILYYDKVKKRHIEEISNASKAVKEGPSAGKAAIGGPFSLINHDGKRVTEKDFLGKWTLVYFGFTHCPDICPDELQKLAAAIDKIKEKAGIEIVPVFISVDPERDTPEQVHEYVKEFHPKLVGLTGNSDEIKKVARAYRVYYMKTEEEDSDYLVDHSIVMYLMDPNMEFVKFFGKNNDVDSLTDGVIKEIHQRKKYR
ncbi:protein SCO1 homolog 1, mitochondrial-like isoform X2 [Durio zibethinus]|uniref:Protein SCO1 homolog 1, mitochondrial-like isoform X2 n=1 Tax=Durio zibethinus TaxID=66656 RepID=A0A6P6ASC2_DURZI|nr:protein SCO1 homolog 1, mitochondrial-like isoform X2 [Durio zibethinus]